MNGTICWQAIWNEAHAGEGIEHLVIEGNRADSVIVGLSETGAPFRIAYQLLWDDAWTLRAAKIERWSDGKARRLDLESDGKGTWRDGKGEALPHLQGCIDIDIWPTPFTNSFPIRRAPPAGMNNRAEYRMAWVDAITGPEITVKAMPQGYTRLEPNLYRYENLDGSGFTALLPVDDQGLVVDYQGLFKRIYPR